jgi:predicted dehydrogenase
VTQRYYAPALQALERTGALVVTSICDPDTANLALVHGTFQSARPYGSLDEMADSGVTLAIVASPASLHAAQSIRLLGKGVSVLCEKPVAISSADALAMATAAGRTDSVLVVGMSRRFFPATRRIHELLRSQLIGEVRWFDFREGGPFRWPIATPRYFRRDVSGGGVLMDLGVHALDLLRWWFGEPDAIVYRDDAMGGVEVNCHLACRFANGISGDIRLSREHQTANRYAIAGTRGSIEWRVNELDELLVSLNGPGPGGAQDRHSEEELAARSAPSGAKTDFRQVFASQLEHVLAVMQGREAPLVPITDALEGLRLIERCYSTRESLPMPWLSVPEALGRTGEVDPARR